MLENSVWRQYNKTNNFREKLTQFCSMDAQDIIEDDKELYGILKAKFTKKELKLFAMDSANISDDKIKSEFSLNDEEFTQAKYKLYKKLKQDKTKLSFRRTTVNPSEDSE
jgi:hypothetical protein